MMTLHEMLNRQLSNAMVLYMKLHNYHWYVKGPQFYTLHEKFEQLYNEVAGYMDELAERLLTIGGQPVATLAGVLEKTSLSEANSSISAEQMVQSLIDDFQKVMEELKQGYKLAEQEEDEPTADMFKEMLEHLDKHVWMLQAFLGK